MLNTLRVAKVIMLSYLWERCNSEMSQEEFGQMYWNGVRDALRMVQTFLFWKEKNPNEARTIETFVSEALEAVRQKCAPCLKEILGVTFGDEVESAEELLPGLKEIIPEPSEVPTPELEPEPEPEPMFELTPEPEPEPIPEPEITPPPVPPVPEPVEIPELENEMEAIEPPSEPEIFLAPEEPPAEPEFTPEPSFEPAPEFESVPEPVAAPPEPAPAPAEPAVAEETEEEEEKPKRRTFFF